MTPVPFSSKDIFLEGECCPLLCRAMAVCLTLAAVVSMHALTLCSQQRMLSSAGDLLTAQGDIFLSPLCRLLADTPGPAERVLDGNGHKLVLPTGLDAQERLPLILVGAGTTLQLRNITIVHSPALAACLHLGAGT